MKKLILDYSKWRCGLDGDDKLGEGPTELCNSRGYECCLGQFSLQLNPKLTKNDIKGFYEPEEIGVDVDLLTYNLDDNRDEIRNSSISEKAININDDEKTTPEEKIVLLKELFATIDCEIEVINKN